jgi:hypothetical protein
MGGKKIGKNKWLLLSASDTWEETDQKGRPTKIAVSLSFEEYVEK